MGQVLYKKLLQDEGLESDERSSSTSPEPTFQSNHRPKERSRLITAFAALIVLLAILLSSALLFGVNWTAQADTCQDPQIRREWRQLFPRERKNYIDAVLCLQDLPSEHHGRGSLYDDFVYVHMYRGSLSHAAGSFLPWHRAFLHAYETTLRTRCGLHTPIPYWDWSLDHQALEKSSIWNATTGFGGDGDKDAPDSVGKGKCVTDGPFANTTRIYWEGKYNPHCFARSFMHFETEEPGRISGRWFSPENVGDLLRSVTYEDFENKMEGMMHNSLHWGVRGDFSSMAGANDNLFYLHHAMIDRLWWVWQREHPTTRLKEYGGVSFNTTQGRGQNGTLADVLEFDALYEDTTVSMVMNTENRLLCYRY